jgi:general secretion pathway protein G
MQPTTPGARTHIRARTRRPRRRREAMTLIEIMIVMVIMALVATAAGFAVTAALDRARKRQARTDATTVQQAAVAYQLEIGGCPTMDDLVREEILSAQSATTDPWGQPFHIECDGREPTATSPGPDETLGTEDDIP